MLTRLRHFLSDRLDSWQRYPGAHLVSYAIAVCGVILNHRSAIGFLMDDPTQDMLMHLFYTGIFLFPLMVVGPLMREIKPTLSKRYAHGGQIIALCCALSFYAILPASLYMVIESKQTLVILSLIFAWIMLFGAVVTANQRTQSGITTNIRGRSKQGIMKLVIAVVSALIVRGGISASLASIEYLFDVTIDSEIYVDVGILARSILGAAIFLIGLRNDDDERLYNDIFRFFGLYIFIPLATIYALILFAYGLKIMITGTWPRGLIVWMVIGYMLFGMLGYLLTYPARGDYKRLRHVHTGYFVSLLLFVIFLGIAIGKRIDQYGLTTPRYLIIAIGVRMIIISGISLWRSKRSLTAIILTFLIMLCFSTYGPRSAISLPSILQYHHLVTLLQKNNFLTADGYIAPRVVDLSGDVLTGDLNTIYTTASYLGRQEGSEVFQSLYAGTGFGQLSGASSRNVGEQFIESLGVKYEWDSYVSKNFENEQSYFSFYSNHSQIVNTEKNAYSLLIYKDNSDFSEGKVTVSTKRADKSLLTIMIGSTTTTIDLHAHLASIGDSINDGNSQKPLVFTGSNYQFVLTDISGYHNIQDQTTTIDDYKGIVSIW